MRGRAPGHFAGFKPTLTAYVFSAVYQQTPVARGG